MSNIYKGIVLKSIDYNDNDKMVTLFTLEEGKITAVLRGCKKPKAKLKFAFQPFCFAEFELTDNNKLIINADLNDTFFDITKNYDRYIIACNILDIVNGSTMDNQPNFQVFVQLLKTLNLLTNYDNINENVIFAKFIVSFLEYSGYKINIHNCSACGNEIRTKRYYDYNIGGIVCVACKTKYSDEIPQTVYNGLKGLVLTRIDSLINLKIDNETVNSTIMFLTNVINQHYSKKFSFTDKLVNL